MGGSNRLKEQLSRAQSERRILLRKAGERLAPSCNLNPRTSRRDLGLTVRHAAAEAAGRRDELEVQAEALERRLTLRGIPIPGEVRVLSAGDQLPG